MKDKINPENGWYDLFFNPEMGSRATIEKSGVRIINKFLKKALLCILDVT